MKITDLNQGSNTIQYVNQANPPDKQTASQEIKKQESLVDKVELSAQSKEIKKINDVLEMTPDVRADRIEELKKLVQEGRYQVDSEAVAGKMIDQSIIDLIK
jgi:negative regulator of flagellin synthesis FlgM